MFLEEFSPSLRLEVREKIITLKQSRDETLDEYLSYFDSLVTSCPHHGFTYLYLLQRFLGGMMPHEWKMLNEAAGGSVMNLGMDDLWYLIEDMAETSRPRQDQAALLEDVENELANTLRQNQAEAEKSWAKVEAAQKECAYWINEMLKPRVTKEESVEPLEPVLTIGPAEEDLVLMAEKDLVLMAEKDLVLMDEPAETNPVLNVEESQLDPVPWFCVRITPPGIYVTKNEEGTFSSSLAFCGKIRNFQNCKEANRTYLKKRPRHDPFEWKPGWRSIKARLDGRVAMVKGSLPTRKDVKEEPPDQWRGKPSPLQHKFFGQIARAVGAKFDLARPWDPNL